MQEEFQFDYFVIGGGSGGIASAKEAAKLGAKVGCCDYVKPSPIGTKWGLGGTCVNVGCIPKKMMHMAAGWGEYHEMHKNAGWQIQERNKFDWTELIGRVQMHIKSLNWGYKTEFSKAGIQYYNALGKITGPNAVQLTKKDGSTVDITAKYILIATGGRPSFLPDVPNIEKNCLTSDDIFSLSGEPGKILVVGASYIALECAGFLHAFGYDVTVMVRSIFLRGFDQECAERIADDMDKKGIKFIKGAVPKVVQPTEEGKKYVTFVDAKTGEVRGSKEFDNVMLAVGRSADTQNIGLENVGIKTEKNGKIIANDDDTTDAKNIFAIGDCVANRLELTPAAIMAGKLLVRRLFNKETRLMSYKNVATTVFTPLEYGCIGLSEEDAVKELGENAKVYHGLFQPLEWKFSDERAEDYCFTKLVVDKTQNEKVIGFHYLGPHAGEVTQGFSVAINAGANYEDFITTVGIHPTQAEEIVKLTQVKGEGELQAGGC